MFRETIKADDCPNCGKKEGATMGSTAWGHSITCCSDKCGLEIQEKLEENTATKEYEQALGAMYKAKAKVREIKYRGTGVSFEGVNLVT